MISIQGDFAYDFPFEMKLKHKLKDFLEKKVDEKYYLDDQDLERISNWNAYEKPLENIVEVEGGGKHNANSHDTRWERQCRNETSRFP